MSRVEFGRAHAPSVDEVLSMAGSSLAVIDRWRSELPVGDALAVIGFVRAHCDAAESELLAARLEAGASTRSVESLLQGNNKTSKRTAKKRTRRANAVNKNPDIAKKMKNGVLSADQTDVIADAAAKTDGAAAQDDELIDKVAAAPPDQGRKLADEYVRRHTDNQDVQDRHDRQRRLRCVKRWTTNRDTHVLALEGDQTTIDRVEQAIRNKSKILYRQDGGRDRPAGHHPRTRDQRNYDAAIELLTRTGTPPAGKSGNNKSSSGSPRSTIVITMTADQALGSDLTPVGQVGGGLLAPTVLEELFCGSEMVGLVTDPTGLPLWLGRTTRYFTKEQVLALIARDGGCALCHAHYSQCEAHHIIPWEAPARGPTDIDNGAMVCPDCHHWLHDHNLILVRDAETGTWTTRPARPEEIAPKRRPQADQAHPTTTNRNGTHHGRPKDHSGPRPEQHRPKPHERPRTGALF